MRSRSRLLPLLVLLGTLGLCLAPTQAWAVVVPMDFSALSKAADSVVVATAVSTSAHYAEVSSPYKGLIVTDTRFRVTQVAEGTRPQTVTVTQPGGEVGRVGLKVDNYPEFSVGETCVLFLGKDNAVVGGHQGKLRVSRGRVPDYGISTGELGAKVRDARRGVKVPRRPDVLGAAASAGSATLSAGLPAASAEQGAASVAVLAAASTVTISGVSPTKAIAGIDYVTITGRGFGVTRGSGEVLFTDGGLIYASTTLAATTVTSWSDTVIRCKVPAGAASGTMAVVSASGGSGTYAYDTSFATDGLSWGKMPATYRIEDGAPMTGEADQIQAAMATWNAVSLNFQLAYDPTVIGPATPPRPTDKSGDGVNSMHFAALPSPNTGSLAVNYLWYDTGTLKLNESDIFFNSALTWGPTATSSAYDLQTVALHELGHTVGLNDQYPNSWRVMGVYYGPNKRVLTADEIAGVNYLYGASPVIVLPTAPAVSSASHPDREQYYPVTTATFAFSSTSPEGIKGYAYVLDRATTTDPGSIVTTSGTTAVFTGLSQGEYYFHVRGISTLDRLGPVTHFRIRVGVTPTPVYRKVYRFYNIKNGVHFYTADETEKASIIARLSATYHYEGVSYTINTANSDNSQPLYRFYNAKKGVHFYTASESEKASVIAHLSATYHYEGVAWGVCISSPPPASTTVYRFYSAKKGAHFYTASEIERQSVIDNLSAVYSYEGPAYYLAP